jgi:hypothetical protein
MRGHEFQRVLFFELLSNMKVFFQPLPLMTALTLALVNCLSNPSAIQATPGFTSFARINFTPPPPPPERGAPGNRGEGASRGECIHRDLPLTALVPSYEEPLTKSQQELGTITHVWGLTSVEQPSFWFYIPFNRTSIEEIEFVLQTDNNNTIYRTSVSVPSTPGIIRVIIPQNSQTFFMANKPYRWFFKVKVACKPKQSPTLHYVEGWVQRVNLDQTSLERLKQASLHQQAVIYARQGIWYDALTSLAKLRLANPQDSALAEDWKNLLKEIGLEKFATQPLIEQRFK